MNEINVCGFDKETELEHLHKEEKEYTNKMGVCPICKEQNLKYRPASFNGDGLFFEYHCDNCGCDGSENYVMEFTGHTFYDEEIDEEIELYV